MIASAHSRIAARGLRQACTQQQHLCKQVVSTSLASILALCHPTRPVGSSVRSYSHALAQRISGSPSGGAVRTPSETASSSFFTPKAASALAAKLHKQQSGSSAPAVAGALIRSPASSRRFSSVIQQQIGEYARQPQKGITLQQLLAVGPNPSKEALLASAVFLHRELPIRLAKRVRELESLPYGLSQMEPVLRVKRWYEESFREILATPEPRNEADELAFTELLENIYERHTHVVPTLAQGVVTMKAELGTSGDAVLNECPFLQDFLNRFHNSRIGIRLLISQHLAIHQPLAGYIGTIATSISPIGVIRDAISDAARVCEREYGWAPDVEIVGTEEVQVNFVPNHLHHIVFELMKNSMRAVLEHHGVKNYDAPPIQVVLTDDEREFAIKISDQGGGIPRKDMHLIWSYLYSTTSTKSAQQLLDSINGQGGPVVDAAAGHPTNAVGPEGDGAGPMSGFGYGLPLSRLFASYFGGDLNVVSVEGYGTDSYIYLTKLNDVNLFLE